METQILNNNKFKSMNFIPKNSNNIVFKLNDEDKGKILNFHSPISNYYKEIIQHYIQTKKRDDLNNSINFVHKNVISSSKFNFNNTKFIKNINNLEKNNELNLVNRFNDNNNEINIENKNNKNSQKTYYSKILNKTIFFNNTYLNNTQNNYENKFDTNNNNSYVELEDKNSKEYSEEKKSCEKFNYNESLLSSDFKNNSNSKYDNYYIYSFYDMNNSSYYINDDFDRTNENNNKDNQINQNDKDEPNNEPNKKKFKPRPYDWMCYKCFNLNFAFRIYCNRCSEPKDSPITNYFYF